MKVSIVNRSRWPDWFVQAACRKLIRAAGIYQAGRDYTMTIRNTARLTHYRGRGGRTSSTVTIARRYTGTLKNRYWKYPEADTVWIESPSRVHLFLHIVAHEALHATGGHPSKFRKPNGEIDRKDMETWTDNVSARLVDDFAAWWKAGGFREMVNLARDAKMKREQKRVRSADPDRRLAKYDLRIEWWQAKARRAANALKKLNRNRAACVRRLAAKRGGAA